MIEIVSVMYFIFLLLGLRLIFMFALGSFSVQPKVFFNFFFLGGIFSAFLLVLFHMFIESKTCHLSYESSGLW